MRKPLVLFSIFTVLIASAVLTVPLLQDKAAEHAKQAVIASFTTFGLECRIDRADYDILADTLTFGEWSITRPTGHTIRTIRFGTTILTGFNRANMLCQALFTNSKPDPISIERADIAVPRVIDAHGRAVLVATSALVKDIFIPRGPIVHETRTPLGAADWLRELLMAVGPMFGQLTVFDPFLGEGRDALSAERLTLEYGRTSDFTVNGTISNLHIPTDDRMGLGIVSILGYKELCADIVFRATLGPAGNPCTISLSLDAPDAGLIDARIAFLDGDAPPEDIFDAPLDKILLKEASLSIKETGIGHRIARLCRTFFGLNTESLVTQIAAIVWESLPPASRTKRMRKTMDRLTEFLIRPGTITFTIGPRRPLPLCSLIDTWQKHVVTTVTPGPRTLSELSDGPNPHP